MVKIIKSSMAYMPKTRFVGKRYTEADIDEMGTFSKYWGEWFARNDFDKLDVCKRIAEISEDYVGLMRCTSEGYEYWIGRFMAEESNVPDGMSYVDIPAGTIAECYLYGKEGPDIYGKDAHNACLTEFVKYGALDSKNNWFFERYNCPRFTCPDENGNVILDYCTFVK